MSISILFLVTSYLFHFGQLSHGDRCISSPLNVEGDQNSLNVGGLPRPRCVAPIEHMLTGRQRPGVSNFNYEATCPPWFNATLATLGQKFAERHWFSTNIGHIMAEIVIGAQNDTSQTPYYSGTVASLKDAAKRLTATILHDSVWYAEDLFSPQSNLEASVHKIRTRHLVILDKQKRGIKIHPPINYKVNDDVWAAIEKDLKASDLEYRTVPDLGRGETPYGINQFGVASVLWGLAATPIIRAEKFGFPLNAGTDEELEGFLHFWAYIGHMVGLEDEYNVCLQPNVQEARIYFERFLKELLIPYMFEISYHGKVLVEVSILGFTEAIGPIAQFDFIIRRVLEDVVGIQCPNFIKRMSPMGRSIDGIYTRIVKPFIYNSAQMRRLADLIYEGYIQNVSLKLFGFDGTNKTVVSEKAFSW